MSVLNGLFKRRNHRQANHFHSAYLDMNQIQLEALGGICQRLFQPAITTVQLQKELDALMNALSHLRYQCRWLGGSWVHLKGQRPKKVPYHIKLLFELYREKVVTMNNPKVKLSDTSRLGLLLRFRNRIFATITEAAKRPPTLLCGLFNLRHQKTTQATYNVMAAAYQPSRNPLSH